MLTVRDVHKSYGKKGLFTDTTKAVLRGVHLHASPGAVVGLVGESGSGKSTLGRLILGLERADSGDILLEGLPVRQWRARHPGGMSVVFQDYSTSVNPSYTLYHCIREPLLCQRHTTQEQKNIIDALMERVGLCPSLATRLPHEVSGGQLQRACIARAMATNPRFIVFDEAISSLDASLQTQVLDLLRQCKGDMTYLFIAHDIQSVAYFCDDIYFLHKGVMAEHTTVERMAHVSSPCARRLMHSVTLFTSPYSEEHI